VHGDAGNGILDQHGVKMTQRGIDPYLMGHADLSPLL
jgi:hypothetical protein